MSDRVKVVVFPNSLSSWRVMIALEEVRCIYSMETVDLFQWEHLMPEHLRLSPHGTVPVLVTLQGEPLLGEKMLQAIQEMGEQGAKVKLFPDGELGSNVLRFLRKLDDLKIGVLSYGLAFHIQQTSLLRFPFDKEEFFEQSSNYILNRSEKLMDAAEMIRGESPDICAGLKELAEQHQENLPNYLEAEGYDNILKTFHKVLDFFEDELGRDDRSGRWLGGSLISIADITLGLYLHRLWQLGLEGEYYQGGVRPHLAVFYESIRTRPAFAKITGWKENTGERRIMSSEDDLVQNARWGLGAAAVLGGLYLVKKMLKK